MVHLLDILLGGTMGDVPGWVRTFLGLLASNEIPAAVYLAEPFCAKYRSLLLPNAKILFV